MAGFLACLAGLAGLVDLAGLTGLAGLAGLTLLAWLGPKCSSWVQSSLAKVLKLEFLR